LILRDRSRQSLQSELGVNASLSTSTGFGVVVPEADFEYIHEFQDDQRHISASFVEDLRGTRAVFSFENQRPDRDFFRAAFGALVVLPRGVQIFARYHTLLGHSYFDTQGVTAGVRFELGGPSVE
jgi:outer membrane autotransporter protein